MRGLGPVDRSRRVVGLISRSRPGEIPAPTPASRRHEAPNRAAREPANAANRQAARAFHGTQGNAIRAKHQSVSQVSQHFAMVGCPAHERLFAGFAEFAGPGSGGATETAPPRTSINPLSTKRSIAASRRPLLRSGVGPSRRMSAARTGLP